MTAKLLPPKEDEKDFMSDLEASYNLEPSRLASIMLWTISGLVIFMVLWAALSKVEQLTRGQGQVIPSGDIQIVQSLEGGILQELLVQEGDLVEKGQILLRISDVNFSSEERGVEARTHALLAKKARLTAEAEGKPFTLSEEIIAAAPKIAKNEEALYESRQNELKNAESILDEKITSVKGQISEAEADITRMQDSAALLQKELVITREMVEQKAMSKMEELRLQRESSDIKGRINTTRERIKSLQADLKSAQQERADKNDKFRSQALGELNEVETGLTELSANLESIGDRVDRTEIRAPVSGIVNKVAVKTIGGVIEHAQRVIEIVPIDDNLKIVAKISPNDIAFLEVGQDVKVKITAYDPQRYGSLQGKLIRLGANSSSDQNGNIYFEAEVTTEKNHLGSEEKPLPITPGMVAQIEIVTGKRSILSYLAKPFTRAFNVALTER